MYQLKTYDAFDNRGAWDESITQAQDDSQHIVKSYDDEINALRRQIIQMGGVVEKQVSGTIRLLAIRQSMTVDHRLVAMAMEISSDLERIGDHACNIAEKVRYIMHSEHINRMPLPKAARLIDDW